MPLCEGRADGPGSLLPCPDKRNDGSVRGRQGDLMLCDACCEYRFPSTKSMSNLEDVPGLQADRLGERKFDQCDLLYFVQNKCGMLEVDKLVHICTNFYKCHEVESARNLLNSYKRLPKHTGGTIDERRERTMTDIVKLCLTPNIVLPVFFSTDMSRIPPVGIEHVDVSALLREVFALREEVRSLAAVRSEIAAMRQTLVDVSALLREVYALREEVRSLAAVRSEIAAMRQTLAEQKCEAPSTRVVSAAVPSTSVVQCVSNDAVATAQTDSVDTVNMNMKSYAAHADSLKTTGMIEKPKSHTAKKVPANRPEIAAMRQTLVEQKCEAPSTRVVSAAVPSTSVVQCVSNDAVATAQTDSVDTVNMNMKSYAAHADSLKTTGMIEKPKSHTAKKVPANRPVVGQSTSANHLKSVVTKRSIDIFVSRLSPETEIDEVKTCVDNVMHGEFPTVIVCTKLASRYENLYSSFYVCVSVSSRDMSRALELVNDAQSWPDGVLVRRYFKPKSNNG